MIVNIKNKKTYVIELPDGRKARVWFDGIILETILKAYNIPYKIVRK